MTAVAAFGMSRMRAGRTKNNAVFDDESAGQLLADQIQGIVGSFTAIQRTSAN